MKISSIDGYEKKSPKYSYLRDDKDFFKTKTAEGLIELLDTKEEHYMYFITDKLVEKVLKKEWTYEENVERAHIYPLVTWHKKKGKEYYVGVTLDKEYEGVLMECLGERYREGLAMAWKYTVKKQNELLWMSHSEIDMEWDWETKVGTALALVNSQCWIGFYNGHDRELENYKYYEEVKRGIEDNIEEREILESIKGQRKTYYSKILERAGYKSRET